MPQVGVYTSIDADADIAAHKAVVNAHHNEIHGAAKHNNVTRELFLPANEGHIGTGDSWNLDEYGVALKLANGNGPDVFFTIKVPDDFVSFVSVKAVWESPAASGNMFWVLWALYVASGEAYDTHQDYAPVKAVTATAGAGIVNVQEPANPLTLADLAKGDYIGIDFYREGSDGLDTLDADVNFFGLLFTYVAEQ